MLTLARPAGARLFAKLGLTLPQVLDLHRQRRALLALDARMLNDIGLTPAQAQAEGARAPWDAPPTAHRKEL